MWCYNMCNYANLKTTPYKITYDDIIYNYLYNLICEGGERLEILYSVLLAEGDGHYEVQYKRKCCTQFCMQLVQFL
jgi:hypothetical protein